MSINMRNLHHKLFNGKNLIHESLNFKSHFFLSSLTDNLGNFSTNPRPHYQNRFLSIFGLTNCVMPKRASVQLLHGQMRLDIGIEHGAWSIDCKEKCVH